MIGGDKYADGIIVECVVDRSVGKMHFRTNNKTFIHAYTDDRIKTGEMYFAVSLHDPGNCF